MRAMQQRMLEWASLGLSEGMSTAYPGIPKKHDALALELSKGDGLSVMRLHRAAEGQMISHLLLRSPSVGNAA